MTVVERWDAWRSRCSGPNQGQAGAIRRRVPHGLLAAQPAPVSSAAYPPRTRLSATAAAASASGTTRPPLQQSRLLIGCGRPKRPDVGAEMVVVASGGKEKRARKTPQSLVKA